ncbi:MAG TPA: hypothetical protein VKE98_08210, partial [Gemmataceae bacterium]|nr:hypothetical protein [Gemmataceae bacterium]
MKSPKVLTLILGLALASSLGRGQEADFTKAAQAFRQANQPVQPISDSTILCEAEEFRVESPGWQAKPFGTNYFAATFANCFLSRKAYLGAPEQCDKTVASIEVQVPKAGRYLALIRYESCYRFETQFRLQIEQGGKTKLDRLYGARDNVKIWAFREKLKKEVAWSWGAGENIVWEGHDAYVDLQPGKAKLLLIAGKQPTPAAKRNVDLVMLTSDEAQVKMRIEKENYLPLDGMLTQAGDVYLKLHNSVKGSSPMILKVPNGTEHSPYWVHLRTWKPITLTALPGKSTDWVEVGHLLDTLSDGQWNFEAWGSLSPSSKGPLTYSLEFAVKDAAGKMTTIKKFENLKGNVTLAYDADTRYTKRIRLADDVLYDLLAYLKKQPVTGQAPKRTLIFGTTFSRKPNDAKYNAAIDEFVKLMGVTAFGENFDAPGGLVRGTIDVRGIPTPKLEEYCKKLKAEGKADKIAVVSLGDEIGLAVPPANDHKGFHAWLKSKNLKPKDVDPAAGDDWSKVQYNPAKETSKTKPELFYYSKIYSYRYGIGQLKERTDILKKYLPNAGIGANFSPHHNHMYLGDTHHWISVFREGGMTMPWGEDYIFQVPVGTQQMNSIMVDMFRAAIKNQPKAKIHYYVMAHTPNNTANSWRRQFYGDLAHGVKIFNLFEFRPVQAAYTENHVNSPAMYQEVRKAFHELGKFEDIIQDGQVRPGLAAIWCSETADVWDNHRAPFDAAKRCLYIALRHQQIPLDFVVDGDDLKGYQHLYLTDANVSLADSKAIADWVKGGGWLIATAGAGMFDEFNRPNKILRELMAVDQKQLEESPGEPIRFEKQDLPFAKPITTVAIPYRNDAGAPRTKALLPVLGVRSNFVAQEKKYLLHSFPDGTHAILLNKKGKGWGWTFYCGFLPGLSYFQQAMPLRPMDRGTKDQSMTHYLPADFNEMAGKLLAFLRIPWHVKCSEPLVESTVIEAPQGVVIPLINWKGKDGLGVPIKNLRVTVNIPV